MLGLTTSIVMLPLLSAVLFIVYMHKPRFLKSAGFDRPIIGMLLVGSMFGLVADIPLIVSREALLNINLGGALIPVIISLHLLYIKKLYLPKILFGIITVGITSFYITRYEPYLGIVAEFPQYFLPSVIGILMGVILFRKKELQIPLVYSITVLGVLIGADIVRIPLLVDEGVLGSIGGAGAMDLVYLSGLIAVVPLVVVYYFSEPMSITTNYLKECKKRLESELPPPNRDFCIRMVDLELVKAARLYRRMKSFPNEFYFIDKESVLHYLGLHPYVIKDYHRLKISNPNPSPEKSLKTAYLLSETIKRRINELFTSLSSRILAYFLDLVILAALFLLFFFIFFQRFFIMKDISLPVLLAIISLAISIQFIYFTLIEWYFGASVGKMILGLEVVSDDFRDISFIQSAARNSARYADIILLFYIISLLLIINKVERKRIGDYIAGTRVVKVK